MLAIVFGVGFGVTYSALSSSKTATGVISIVVPPSANLTSTNLYIDTNNPAVYIGNDTSGTQVTSSTTLLPKLVLTDTQSGTSAYIKIEIEVLGISGMLSYNTSGAIPTFSDSTTMNISQTEGLIILTTNGAVREYSYIFLDSIISNLQTVNQLTNATLQLKIYSSLDSSFINKSVNQLYYNINSSEDMYSIVTFIHSGTKPTSIASTETMEVRNGSVIYFNEVGTNVFLSFEGNETNIYNGYYSGEAEIASVNNQTKFSATITQETTITVKWQELPPEPVTITFTGDTFGLNNSTDRPSVVNATIGDILRIETYLGYSTYMIFYLNDEQIYVANTMISPYLYMVGICYVNGTRYGGGQYQIDEIVITTDVVIECVWSKYEP